MRTGEQQDRPADTTVPPGRIFLRAVAILVISLSLTVMVWWLVREQALRLSEARFQGVAQDAATRIADRMEDYAQILRGGVAFMAASERITRAEWRSFVDLLDVETRYPGIQGIGFAQFLTAGDVAAYEAELRAEGFHDHAVTPPGERAAYTPIRFLEPFSGRNLRAFGYDMFSEPVRRDAMLRAMDTGLPALSSRVILVQETDTDIQAGTLLYLPFYRQGATPADPEARRRALAGFVYSPFRMDDLIKGILGAEFDELRVNIFDNEVGAPHLLYGSGLAPADSPFRDRRALRIFGRTWVVDMAPAPAFAASLDSGTPALVLGAGIVISFLLMWTTQAMVSEHLRRRALSESNRQLVAARAEAVAANVAKSRFLAAASHDIRQPAQSMMLLMGALAQRLEGHPALPLVDHFQKAMDALRSLLDELLDVSRLDAGVVVPRLEPVPLAPLLERLAAEYHPAAERKGLRLRAVACSAVLHSDPLLLERILRNLLENAVRYTPAGRILVGCRRHPGGVRIQVWDSGIGIPDDQVARIFDEFHQVGNPERDRSQGLGLGLAIVRRLAHLLNHHVSVCSRLGRGSCFSVDVPLSATLPQPGEKASPPACRFTGPVVVIDDEKMVRDGLRVLLEGWGAEVVAADSAEAALPLLGGRRPDVIIADYRLRGGATGLAAIAHLEQAFPEGGIRTILLTGDTAPERIAEAQRGGCRILHKPVTPPELQAVLAAE